MIESNKSYLGLGSVRNEEGVGRGYIRTIESRIQDLTFTRSFKSNVEELHLVEGVQELTPGNFLINIDGIDRLHIILTSDFSCEFEVTSPKGEVILTLEVLDVETPYDITNVKFPRGNYSYKLESPGLSFISINPIQGKFYASSRVNTSGTVQEPIQTSVEDLISYLNTKYSLTVDLSISLYTQISYGNPPLLNNEFEEGDILLEDQEGPDIYDRFVYNEVQYDFVLVVPTLVIYRHYQEIDNYIKLCNLGDFYIREKIN